MLNQELFLAANQNDKIVTPLLFDTPEQKLYLGFSSPLNLAQFFKTETHFIQTSLQQLIDNLLPNDVCFGHDFGQKHASIYTRNEIESFLNAKNEFEFTKLPTNPIFRRFKPNSELNRALTKLLNQNPKSYRVGLILEAEIGLIAFVDTNDEHNYLFVDKLKYCLQTHCDENYVSICAYNDELELIERFMDNILWAQQKVRSSILKPPKLI